MNYLCLAYYDEETFGELSEDELESIGKAARARDQALQESGHLLASGSLLPSASSTSLRHKQGEVSITDGPWAETKEQIGGFFVLEAKDLNEAIRVASKHPAANMGEHVGWGVEIRPIESLEQF